MSRKIRSIRVDDHVWNQIDKISTELGTSRNQLIEKIMKQYVFNYHTKKEGIRKK